MKRILNQPIDLYEFKRKRLMHMGHFIITGMTSKFIIISNDHYRGTIQIHDLRSGQFVLRRQNGSDIRFKPLENMKNKIPDRLMPEGKEVV